jgi:hypothetical protein
MKQSTEASKGDSPMSDTETETETDDIAFRASPTLAEMWDTEAPVSWGPEQSGTYYRNASAIMVVPGGWLLKHRYETGAANAAGEPIYGETMVFVPTPTAPPAPRPRRKAPAPPVIAGNVVAFSVAQPKQATGDAA